MRARNGVRCTGPVCSVLMWSSLAWSVCCVSSWAAEPTSALSGLLEQVRQAREAGSIADRKREQVFLEHYDERRRLLERAKQRLQQLTAESARLEKQFNANELKLAELETLYRQRAGNFDELSGVFRSAAADLETQFAHSIAAVGVDDWRAPLAEMRLQKSLPSAAQLDQLKLLFLELMTLQAANAVFDGEVVSPVGETERRRVVRIGAFTATADGDFLSYQPGQHPGETGRLFELARQPASRYVDVAESFAGAAAGAASAVAAAIDPSRGSILSLLVLSPTLGERIEQGGLVGYMILLIGMAGLLIGVERLWTLNAVHRAVSRQCGDIAHPGDNPLGRVLAAARPDNDGTLSDNEFEVLELKVDDAVTKEVPRLQRGLGAMKVFAAIAPLLGLLGTVTGMIETFQAITLFGTGDPKLMAGGISQALVTTAMGLIVAVFILLLHTFANARSRLIREVLETQSAGLLAQQAELRGGSDGRQ